MSGIDLETAWPAVLFALRVGAVVLLYLFLFTAFRTLRADLRPAPASPERRQPGTAVDEGAALDTTDLSAAPSEIEDSEDAEAADAAVADRGLAPKRRAIPLRVAVPAAAALVLILGSAAALLALEPAGDGTDSSVSENVPFGPPAATPAPGRVTVGLAATEDSQVRVTVDGVVQFDGTLRARERQSWEGGERIQVWTDSGRTLHLAVNGENLGPYSPAMGHPEWNRIDFGFWPGWAR